MRNVIVLMGLGAVAIACGSGDDRSFDPSDPGNGAPPSSLGNNNPGSLGSSSGTPPNETCAAAVNKATRAKVDVIVVIDTSGSMDEETNQVKSNINTFASKIGGTGLDYTVLFIAAKPGNPGPIPIPGFTLPGVCVPQPLAGADCADNPPIFHQLNKDVESTDSLKIIIDNYATYEPWLRTDAYKVFIEVTDDNSTDMSHTDFDTKLLAKSKAQFGDATSRKYIFNSICGWKRNTAVKSSEKCDSAVNIGSEYQDLSVLTGGTVESVCEKDYSSVFDNIAKGLVTKLGCEFGFPKSQTGQTDPTTVVVNYTAGNASAAKQLTQVTDQSKCGTIADAWYYDDNANPTKIIFCPTTCTTAGADTAGKLEVAVGCKAPPPK